MEMNKYKRGKIYKIIDNTTDKIYIGSTCEPTLARRLSGHVRNYKSYLNGKIRYVSSFDILANSDYDIVLIELCPCQTKDELLARERYHSDTFDCVNRCRPIISNVERKEYMAKYDKQYHHDHKEAIKKQQNAKNNCFICNGRYTNTGKAQHMKTKQHQNCISLKGILNNHETLIKNIDIFINELNNFIEKSNNFILGLNI